MGAKDAAANEIQSFAAKSSKLKHEGDAHFAAKRHKEALEAYEKAIPLTLGNSEERAALHSNRAACFLMMNSFHSAHREATQAIEADATYKPALMRRALAAEKLGLYDRVVTDLKAALELDPSSGDLQKKLQSATKAVADAKKSAKRGGVAGLGGGGLGGRGAAAGLGGTRAAAANRDALAARARQQQLLQQQQQQLELVLNCSLGEATKTVKVPMTTAFGDIAKAVKSAFSDELDGSAIALKYKDPEGDLITATCRADVRYAMASHVAAKEAEAKAKGEKAPSYPGNNAPVDLVVTPVKKAPRETPDQVAPPHVGAQGSSPTDGEDEQAEDVIEIDEWLLSFATLFREHLGEAGAKAGPLDLREIGLEKCVEALESAVGDAKAQELLGSAAEKFQEAAAAAVFNWGNAHVCVGRKLVDTSEPEEGAANEDAESPAQVPSDAAMAKAAKTHMKRLDEEYEKAVAKYTQALAIKKDFYEASIAWGQQAFERGKIAHAAAKAGENAEANAKETDAMFTLAEEKFAESLEMLPESEKEAVNKSEPIDGESASLASQILILHGNVLFERSQVRHHREEKNWAEDCDAAVAKFNKAGCSKEDITRALMNHTSGTWKEEAEAKKKAEA